MLFNRERGTLSRGHDTERNFFVTREPLPDVAFQTIWYVSNIMTEAQRIMYAFSVIPGHGHAESSRYPGQS